MTLKVRWTLREFEDRIFPAPRWRQVRQRFCFSACLIELCSSLARTEGSQTSKSANDGLRHSLIRGDISIGVQGHEEWPYSLQGCLVFGALLNVLVPPNFTTTRPSWQLPGARNLVQSFPSRIVEGSGPHFSASSALSWLNRPRTVSRNPPGCCTVMASAGGE